MNADLRSRYLPLEDDFNDIISKAVRGNVLTTNLLAERLRVEPAQIEAWISGRALPETSAIAQLAEILQLKTTALQASAGQDWHPLTMLPQGVRTYIQHSHPESNGYLLTSDDDHEIALVDPAGDVQTLFQEIEQAARPLRYLLVTHRHDDHSDAAAQVGERFPQTKIIMHETEAATRSELAHGTRSISDGEQFPFGTAAIVVHVTPGHTDGSTCFSYNDYICVGDMLFAGSVGRTFGPIATYIEQLRNIVERILALPAHTVILPGHGPVTTVGLERIHNPFFL